MDKILVTGGSGFIGTNLVQSLAKKYSVLNVDNTPPVNIKLLPFWRKCDILDFVNLEKEILSFNPDYVIHLAAITDLNGRNKEYYRANVEGTRNIITICEKLDNLKKVIFTSSMYVCKPGYIPKTYDDYKPHTLYGESKVEGELLVKTIPQDMFNWVIIRPTSIWGPWFGIPYIDFFNIVYKGKYFDFGRTCSKTYGYVENIVFQIERILTSDRANFKTMYLGDNPPVQISDWANEIALEFHRSKIKKIPFPMIKIASLFGDLLSRFSIRFPITSFRLTNMTTNNILPLDEIYAIANELPVSRTEGTRQTINWLVNHKGYARK
jgi:nucleoside-diphosphate-sugar epimerase